MRITHGYDLDNYSLEDPVSNVHADCNNFTGYILKDIYSLYHTGTYKIPSFNDVPRDLRVELMDKSNKRAVHSSKGIGEPPFLTSISVFLAIRNAIAASRVSNGKEGYFCLRHPATSERIRMACGNELTTVDEKEGMYQPKGSW